MHPVAAFRRRTTLLNDSRTSLWLLHHRPPMFLLVLSSSHLFILSFYSINILHYRCIASSFTLIKEISSNLFCIIVITEVFDSSFLVASASSSTSL
jgi:hypothetical protein